MCARLPTRTLSIPRSREAIQNPVPGASAGIDGGGLTGEIAASSAINGIGPIAEIGAIHPVDTIDEPNATVGPIDGKALSSEAINRDWAGLGFLLLLNRSRIDNC